MTEKNNLQRTDLCLDPLHHEDLKKSGLSNETIRDAKITSVPPNMINRVLGGSRSGLRSIYEIPYDDEYSRYKLFYEEGKSFSGDGNKNPKYLTQKNAGNRLYIPPSVRPILNDPSHPIYITEGEKKALKAAQEGLHCIALPGLWNWKLKDKDELIPDFDEIELKGRAVYLVPDNDWQQPNKEGEPKNLKQAVHECAYLLIDRGAAVSWIELPVGDKKTGLDDYLCEHSMEEFRKLPVHDIRKLSVEAEIESITSENADDYAIKSIEKRIAGLKNNTKRDLMINRLSEKLGVNKKSIERDVKYFITQNGSEDPEPVLSANFPGLVDLAIKENGDVVFLIKSGDSLLVHSAWKIDGIIYAPPAVKDLPFTLPRASEVLRLYLIENDTALLQDLIAFLKRFSYLPDDLWLIVACTVLLSYIQDHDDIKYMPELLFFAVPERGKTRTGKAVTYVSYRGIHLVELREANLFRYSENMKATLFFDIMDLWKKAERNNVTDILLLRFEKGATASRVLYPERGKFKDMEHYDIYGPTIIATNQAIHAILDSRCIPITMPNRRGIYEDPSPDKALPWKERLTAWRAKVMNSPLPEVEPVEALTGRLWDISKPLLQVCKLVHPEVQNTLISALVEIADQKSEDKRSSIEGRIIAIIDKLLPEDYYEEEIKTAAVLEELNKDRPADKQYTSQWIGKRIKALGINRRISNGRSTLIIKFDAFNDLLIQYGLHPEKNSLLSQNTQNTEKTTTYNSESAGESQSTLTDSHSPEHTENKGINESSESSETYSETVEEAIVIQGEQI